VDLFSTLPNELLDSIFDIAHSLDHPLTGPPSRRFLPSFNRTLYREILVENYTNFERLCDTAKLNPAVLSNVKRLDVTIEMIDPDETEFGEWKEKIWETDHTDNDILHLFRQLIELEELELVGTNRIAHTILLSNYSVQPPLPIFSTLKALDVTSTFDDGITPTFDRSLLREANLSRFTQLSKLSWDIRTGRGNFGYNEISNSDPVLLPPQLEELSLTGDMLYSTWTWPYLVPPENLTSLALNDTADLSNLSTALLAVVRHPEKIRHLELWLTNDDAVLGPAEPEPVEDLSRFRNLETLVLQGPFVPATRQFYLMLSQLPLRRLSFKIDTEVSTSELIDLITTSSSSLATDSTRTLKRITLDNVDSVKGEDLPRDQGVEAVRDADLIGLGWNLANWSELFTIPGLKELIEVGRREGVIIDGYSVQSLEVEAAWEEEMIFYRETV
jgi:hypothetical protein